MENVSKSDHSRDSQASERTVITQRKLPVTQESALDEKRISS